MDAAGFLRVGTMVVGGGRCFVADERVPVVAELDAADGRVLARYTWPLDPAHRRLTTTSDLALQGGDLLVASPAAGGLVRIERSTGAVTVTRLAAPPVSVAVDGELAWVVVARDDGQAPGDAEDEARHPVEWVEPTEPDRARAESALADLVGQDRAGGMVAGPLPTRDDVSGQDEVDVVDRSHDVYVLSGDRLDRVDVGVVEGIDGVVVAGRFVCVAWRGDDPIVKRVTIGGGLAFERPSSLLTVAADGTVRRIGRVEDDEELAGDGDRVWLLGTSRRDRATVRAVDLAHGPSEPVELDADEAVGVVAGHVVCVVHDRRLPWEVRPGDAWRRGTSLVLVPPGGGAGEPIALPRVATDRPVVDGTTVWFARRDGSGVVAVEAGTAAVRELAVEVDCRPLLAAPEPPPGIDLREFERAQAAAVRVGLTSPLVAVDGTSRPLVRGVTFDLVEVEGTFPTATVVARFRADSHPGVRFARRWRLYDDLGDPMHLGDADVEVVEDLEAIGYGLPAPDACEPDDTGTVWF